MLGIAGQVVVVGLYCWHRFVTDAGVEVNSLATHTGCFPASLCVLRECSSVVGRSHTAQ